MQKRSVLLVAALCAVVLPLSVSARFWPPTGQLIQTAELILWGPSSQTFYQLPVGQSIVLKASASDANAPILSPVDSSLDCIKIPPETNTTNAQWRCTAKLKNASNPNVYYTLNGQRSNVIVIQVELLPVCGFTPDGGGTQCEENMSENDCAARNGTMYESNETCWRGEERVICGFTPAGGGRQCEDNMRSAECAAKKGAKYNSISDCWAASSSRPTQTLKLTLANGQNFYEMAIASKIFITSNVPPSLKPVLHGVKTEQLRCEEMQGNPTTVWGCLAFAVPAVPTNSEVYFTIGNDDTNRSNSIVLQVARNENRFCYWKPNSGYFSCAESIPKSGCTSKGGIAFVTQDECLDYSPATSSSSTPCIGCDRDAHGCLPSAGYSWCAAKQKCLRTWEEPCSGTTSSSPSAPPAGYEDEVLTNFDAYTNPFPDTDMKQFSGKAAAELYRRAVIGGFPDGQFKGDRPVNRAEAAKFFLLARFGTVADASNNGQFSDVLDGQWYTKFVVTAAQKGIIKGNPDGTFRPGNQVNKAEFLKMLALTFDLPLNLPHSYDDVSVNDWFAPYVGIDQKYILFYDEKGNQLHPQKPLTREEVAMAIYKYLRDR